MKQVLLAIMLLLALLACANEAVNGGGGDVDQFSLTEFIQRLEATGDLTARAVTTSGVISQISDGDFPLRLYLLNEGNYFLGADSAEGSSETVFERGDKPLQDYIAEQGLSEEEFLNHPRLRDFVESHLIPTEVRIFGTRDNVTETYTAVGGNKIVLSTDFSREEGVIFANGVATEGCFLAQSVVNGENANGHLCFTDTLILEDFDWSN